MGATIASIEKAKMVAANIINAERARIIEETRRQEQERIRPYVEHLESIAQAAYLYRAHSTPDNSQEAKDAHKVFRNALLAPIDIILQR
jgi:hypothetical protein